MSNKYFFALINPFSNIELGKICVSNRAFCISKKLSPSGEIWSSFMTYCQDFETLDIASFVFFHNKRSKIRIESFSIESISPAVIKKLV